MIKNAYLFVGANAGRTTEVELRSFNCERLTGARVTITIKSAAFTAVHG